MLLRLISWIVRGPKCLNSHETATEPRPLINSDWTNNSRQQTGPFSLALATASRIFLGLGSYSRAATVTAPVRDRKATTFG
jgi:hypothetical protein